MRVSTAQVPGAPGAAGIRLASRRLHGREHHSRGLENLVHIPRQDFPRGYVCVAAVLPDGISMIHAKGLRKNPALEDLSTEQLGDWWFNSRQSAVLQVPSFVIPGEHNFCSIQYTRNLRGYGRATGDLPF